MSCSAWPADDAEGRGDLVGDAQASVPARRGAARGRELASRSRASAARASSRSRSSPRRCRRNAAVPRRTDVGRPRGARRARGSGRSLQLWIADALGARHQEDRPVGPAGLRLSEAPGFVGHGGERPPNAASRRSRARPKGAPWPARCTGRCRARPRRCRAGARRRARATRAAPSPDAPRASHLRAARDGRHRQLEPRAELGADAAGERGLLAGEVVEAGRGRLAALVPEGERKPPRPRRAT